MISYREEGPEIEPYFTRYVDYNGNMVEGGFTWEEARNEVVSWYKYKSIEYLTKAEEFRKMTEQKYFG